MSILDIKVAGSNLSINMFSPWARDFIRIASVDTAVKWVPGGDNLMKSVQCYELFGGIALKNHTFSFFISAYPMQSWREGLEWQLCQKLFAKEDSDLLDMPWEWLTHRP